MKFFKSILKAFSEVDWSNVPKATYVRYILAIITIVNNVLVACGLHPVDVSENTVYMVVTVLLNVVVVLVNTYKDNPTSKEGIMAASIRNLLKQMDDLEESGVLDELKEWLEEKNNPTKKPDAEIPEEKPPEQNEVNDSISDKESNE